MKACVGIDPGLRGAMAVISYPERKVLSLEKLPVIKAGSKSEIDKNEMERLLLSLEELSPVIYIEKQQAMPKQGVTSIFTCGYNYGIITAIVHMCKYPYFEVSPRVWAKTVFGVNAAGLKSFRKERNIKMAMQLFPGVSLITERGRKPHDGFADALLIAYYGAHMCANKG